MDTAQTDTPSSRRVSLLLDYLTLYFGGYAYLGFFLLLAIGGLGLPIPEELSLIAAGLFVSWGAMDLIPALLVCGIGMILGDLLFFAIGHFVGQRPLHGLLRRLAPADRIERTMLRLRKYGLITVFFGRYLTGIRPAVFLGAGAMRIPVGRFLLFDGLSAISSLFLWVFVGLNYSSQIEVILHRVGQFEEAILAVVAAIVIVIAVEKVLIHVHRLEPTSRPVRIVQAARVPIIIITAVFALLLARQHLHTQVERLTKSVAAGIPSPVRNPGLMLDLIPRIVPPNEPVDLVLVCPRELLDEALHENAYERVPAVSAVLLGRAPSFAVGDADGQATIALWRSSFVYRDVPVWMGRALTDHPDDEARLLTDRLVATGYTPRVSVGSTARTGDAQRVLFAVLRRPKAPRSPRNARAPSSGYNP